MDYIPKYTSERADNFTSLSIGVVEVVVGIKKPYNDLCFI